MGPDAGRTDGRTLARPAHQNHLKPLTTHLVENEAFFLDAAHTSGLTVPPHQLVADRHGAPGLLVRRFDRITVSGEVRALAVEDGCQAADRPPADKYLLSAERT